jgi:NAD(P) transhydrogenase subunit alpha
MLPAESRLKRKSKGPLNGFASIALCASLIFSVQAAALMAQSPSDAGQQSVPAEASPKSKSRPSLVFGITIFALAIFLGVELIGKVPATLHTPLMSGSNAISGITVVGAIIAAGAAQGLGPPIAFVAVVLATINVVGGFLVTQRMLQMFKRK